MCCENNPCLKKTGTANRVDRGLSWVEVAKLYSDPKRCLASYLAFWSAEVLTSVKPANLVRINNRELPCGRNMYRLWLDFGEQVMRRSALKTKILKQDNAGILLFLYQPALLQRRLNSRTMRTFLQNCGYPQPLTVQAALNHLQSFYQEAVADEIGMFLGYPLKDVKGFMEKKREPWQGSCLWRIYGPVDRSLQLHTLYLQAREQICSRLAAKDDPLFLLKAA